MTDRLKVGDRVEDLVYHKGMTGTVTEVLYENTDNPIEDHGFVTVMLDPEHVGRFPCCPPNEEHYAHYNWQETLRLLTN